MSSDSIPSSNTSSNTSSVPSSSDRALTRFLPSAQATHDLGLALGRSLPPGTNLLLHGNLGSGKTTLVQGLGQGLGITDPIVSPTFTLINEYLDGRIPLYHLDLYRLTTEAATFLTPEIYWEGIDYDLGIVVIEWAERLAFDPPQCLNIEFSFTPTPSAPDGIGRSVMMSVLDDAHVDLIDLLKAIP